MILQPNYEVKSLLNDFTEFNCFTVRSFDVEELNSLVPEVEVLEDRKSVV